MMLSLPISDDTNVIRLAPGSGRDPGDVERDIEAHLAAGIDVVRRHLLAGRPGRALYELTRSLERQIRVAGLGAIPITAAPCPCGGGPTCPRDYRHQLRYLNGKASR